MGRMSFFHEEYLVVATPSGTAPPLDYTCGWGVANMLQARALTCSYGSQLVYADLWLDLHPGELVVITGVNGIGKSSLLRTLAGWQPPTRGEVFFDDPDGSLKGDAKRCRLAFVPDTPDFYDELTLWEHFTFLGGINHIDGWENKARSVLASLLLTNSLESYPFVLSRGMRQKFAIALALLVSPRLMLLDEPFGPLDAEARQVVWDLLRFYCAEGGSVLLSSHARPTEGVADRYVSLTDDSLRGPALPLEA